MNLNRIEKFTVETDVSLEDKFYYAFIYSKYNDVMVQVVTIQGDFRTTKWFGSQSLYDTWAEKLPVKPELLVPVVQDGMQKIMEDLQLAEAKVVGYQSSQNDTDKLIEAKADADQAKADAEYELKRCQDNYNTLYANHEALKNNYNDMAKQRDDAINERTEALLGLSNAKTMIQELQDAADKQFIERGRAAQKATDEMWANLQSGKGSYVLPMTEEPSIAALRKAEQANAILSERYNESKREVAALQSILRGIRKVAKTY